ncbi:ATP-binding protein [Streptomyces coeruleofuscus]|uniref:Histidine kinase/HSP90-like ATPase domain-containing protein n=1 Tax=Streptomyces coeruleofuscus TaxID=66879 RepID=A0ABN3IBU4_9ACTN
MNVQHRSTRSLQVPVHACEVPLVRRSVLDILREWGVPDDDDAAQAVRVIVSELLTNVVLHASATTAEALVVVELLDGSWIRLGVHDSHPACPSPRGSDADTPHGRGLWIVHALLEELSGVMVIERTGDGGKTIWAVLPRSAHEQIVTPGQGGRTGLPLPELQAEPSAA